MPILYFLAGFFTCVFMSYLFAQKQKPQLPKKQRTWERIQNLKYDLNFELRFLRHITANELGRWIPSEMHRNITERPLPEIDIKPGVYTVNVEVNARFIKREDENEKDQSSARAPQLDGSQR